MTKPKTYYAAVVCKNCGWGEYGEEDQFLSPGHCAHVRIKRGTPVSEYPCRNCGCKSLINLDAEPTR